MVTIFTSLFFNRFVKSKNYPKIMKPKIMVKGFEITQFESLKIKKIESSGIKVIISYESLENKQPCIISSIWNFNTILNIKDID